VPLAALVIAVAWRHVPESRAEAATGRVDFAGGALVTLGLIGVTYGLIDGPSAGWNRPAPVAALVGGTVLLIAFVLRERRARMPVLPLSLFSSAQFSAANAVTFVVYGALGGVLFLLPIQLEQVSGYTALQAGISLLPVTVIMLALSARSGALAAKIGPRLQMTAGPVIIAAGLALFARIGHSASYLTEVLPAMLVFGLGLAINVAPLTTTVLAAAPPENAGAASAVNNDVARAAGLIAVAVLPAAAGLTGAAYLNSDLFSAGFRTAAFISAGVCLLGAVLAAATIRNPRPAAARPAGAGQRPLLHCGLDCPPARPAQPARPTAAA
jgi:predicted MFS family arabinose efflux permease